ncbi:MAG: NAD(P)H-binding protein [Clostridia bacterium]|nr:NAD(P)H-binding protein [Deltaproteobacteria bacterium]
MIVVTGVTGQLGSAIVESLLALVPGNEIVGCARDPAKAKSLAGRLAHLYRADFDDPASLRNAFKGASQVLLVSSNAAASGGDPLAQHRNAIAVAKECGVDRVLYTSHMGCSATSAFPPMRDHFATERMLADSGVAWTSLRNGFYASTVPRLVGDAAMTGVIEAPKDGKVSWTTHKDLAAAAARILVTNGRYNGPTPPLTASTSHDLSDIAGLLSQKLGRLIERREITDEAYESRLAAGKLPSATIVIMLGLYRAARAGEFAAVDPTLAALTGRYPESVSTVLAL